MQRNTQANTEQHRGTGNEGNQKKSKIRDMVQNGQNWTIIRLNWYLQNPRVYRVRMTKVSITAES